MLTSYYMKCPHQGCTWFGSLLPRRDPEAWRDPAAPRTSIVEFKCPRCQGQWRARVVGDDAVPLPLEHVALS